MRVNKFLFVLVVLLAGFLLVNASAATELGDSGIADTSSYQDISVNDINNLKVSAGDTGSDVNKLADGEKDFAYLNNLIQNTPKGGELILNQDIVFVPTSDSAFKEGILISKSITINGNGSLINGLDLARVFSIYADDVTITNLTITNTRIDGFGGGAIEWHGDNGSVSDCIFINSSARFGGAISWSGNNGSISDCNFVNCVADNEGGAISTDIYENFVISGCNFTNCSANEGSAIYNFMINLNVSNCNCDLIQGDEKAPIYNDGIISSDIVIDILNTENLYYGESNLLAATLSTSGINVAGKNLIFKVNGKEYYGETTSTDFFIANYTVDFVGERYVDATYKDASGLQTVNMGKLGANKAKIIVTVDDVKGKTGEKVKFIAKVKDIFGTPIKTGSVIFGFNGKEYKVNVENGIATVEVVLPKAGTYSATAYYTGDENHNDAYAEFIVKVIDNSNPKKGIPMEATGNPLVVLLIGLVTVCLGSLKRKL